MTQIFPIDWVRQQFPALQDKFVFFDNGAGAQVPDMVLDAVRSHLIDHNVQRGGRYPKSQKVDATIQRARESVAVFLNAGDSAEIAFGMNATSFIRLVSLALGEILGKRKQIIVTDLDHEANIATWLALERNGAKIVFWKMRKDGTLHTEDLKPLLSQKTRLVACAAASNALGTIVNVKEVARLAHAAGAEVFLDAVHYAPHAPIDVQDWDCDYLVCSGYKIFAPHMGFLWGKRRLLEALPTFREDFIPDEIPTKIEVGTFVYENVAGMDAAIRYLEQLGQAISKAERASRRQNLLAAMSAIREYEAHLSAAMLKGLAALKGISLYGIKSEKHLNHRVPTICFNVKNKPPAFVASRCAETGFGIRDGNMYSPRLLECMGIPTEQGALRASLVHYNTEHEIESFLATVKHIAEE